MELLVDLSLTKEQEGLRDTARDFMGRECPSSLLKQLDKTETGFSADLWKKTAELGWTGILIPPEYGGVGGSLTDTVVLYEELGRGLLPGPHHSSTILCALLILEGGTKKQKEQLLPAIAKGQRILTLAFTELDYGWVPESVQLKAARKGEGYVLTGTKLFVPDVPSADQLICAARTGTGDKGITLFLVDKKAPGVSSRVLKGFLGQKLSEVKFDQVQVRQENVLGEVGHGWTTIAKVMDRASTVLSGYMAGAVQKVLDMSMDYAHKRVQFGVPIAKFQRVQDRLIEMRDHADKAHLTTYEAASKLENGGGAIEASIAKAVVSDALYYGCDEAHHVHGGVGSDKRFDLFLYTQTSRSLYHYMGDPAHHRKRLAALLEL